jgi:ubiquinone/menaquinone biosynthesis C-methylase UbiE
MNQIANQKHFFSQLYDSKARFNSYWHQINETLLLAPSKILEIGIGNKFVSKYLLERNMKVITLDIEESLKPDISGSIQSIPFKDNSFNLVICCELLEHLPYRNFKGALRELHRVSKKNIILSLPDVTTVYRINIELPRLKPIKLLIPHLFHRPTRHQYNGVHYWEIGKVDYPLKRIIKDIQISGFKIIKTYRVFEFYFHRLFLLEK